MLNNTADLDVKNSIPQRQEERAKTELLCNNCNVTMIFGAQPSKTLRKNVAELLVTAFERQIGVREKV